MTLTPLGDQAILASFDDESAALGFASALRQARLPNVIDIVLAYVTVAVFYDISKTTLAQLVVQIEELPRNLATGLAQTEHVIPCCYDLGPDLDRVAEFTGLTIPEIIRLHSTTTYTVYAIGFCPGFPYLGYLPAPLCGVPRLPTPRIRVEAGSVGLTGRQTGLYPLERPGGWNLIGRTPLQLVDVAAGYFPLRPGERVRFEAIDRAAFDRLKGQRLDV